MSDAAAATAAATPAAAPVAPPPAAPEAPAPAAPAAPSTPEQRRSAATARAAAAMGLVDPEAPAEAPAEPPAESAPEEPAKAEPAKDEPTEPEEPSAKAFRKIRLEKQAAKKLMQEAVTTKQQVEALRAEIEADRQLLKSDAYAWAKKNGFDFRDLAKRAVADETKDPNKAKLEALEAKLAELEKGDKTRQEQETQMSQQAAVQAVRAHAGQHFDATTPEDFPFLHANARKHGAARVHDAIASEMIEHYGKTSEELPPLEVAKRLEAQLADYYETLSAARPQAAAPAAPAKAPPAAAPKAKRELEPDIPTAAASQRTQPDKPLSQEEKRANALRRARPHFRQ